MPKEWRRFHKDSWVFNRVTIPFPNSHFAISSSAGIVNYSMSSHEKKVRSNIHTHLPAPAGQCWPLISKCFPQGRIDLLQRQVSHKSAAAKIDLLLNSGNLEKRFFSSTFFFVSWRRLIIFLGRRYFFQGEDWFQNLSNALTKFLGRIFLERVSFSKSFFLKKLFEIFFFFGEKIFSRFEKSSIEKGFVNFFLGKNRRYISSLKL